MTPKIVIEITPEGEAWEEDLPWELRRVLDQAQEKLLDANSGGYATLGVLRDSRNNIVGHVRYI